MTLTLKNKQPVTSLGIMCIEVSKRLNIEINTTMQVLHVKLVTMFHCFILSLGMFCSLYILYFLMTSDDLWILCLLYVKVDEYVPSLFLSSLCLFKTLNKIRSVILRFSHLCSWLVVCCKFWACFLLPSLWRLGLESVLCSNWCLWNEKEWPSFVDWSQHLHDTMSTVWLHNFKGH